MVRNQKTNLTRRLAPEEIRTGQYVAVLNIISEFLPLYCEFDQMAQLTIHQLKWLPCEESLPLKVKGVCLPFVMVKSPLGELRTIDVRRHLLAQLDSALGQRMYELFRRQAKRERKRAKKS